MVDIYSRQNHINHLRLSLVIRPSRTPPIFAPIQQHRPPFVVPQTTQAYFDQTTASSLAYCTPATIDFDSNRQSFGQPPTETIYTSNLPPPPLSINSDRSFDPWTNPVGL